MSDKEKPSSVAAASGVGSRAKARFVNVWRVSRAAVDVREPVPGSDAPARSGRTQVEPPRDRGESDRAGRP